MGDAATLAVVLVDSVAVFSMMFRSSSAPSHVGPALVGPPALIDRRQCVRDQLGHLWDALIAVGVALSSGLAVSTGIAGLNAFKIVKGSSKSRGLARIAFHPLALSTVVGLGTFLAAPGGISVLGFNAPDRLSVSIGAGLVMGLAIGAGWIHARRDLGNGRLRANRSLHIRSLRLQFRVALDTDFPGRCGRCGPPGHAGGPENPTMKTT